MAESPDNSADGEKSEPAKSLDGKAVHKALERNLPVVVAPKLGAGEDEAIDEMFDETEDEAVGAVAAGAPAHSTRFLVLAATVAFAATFGSFVGSVSGSGFARYLAPAAPDTKTENASDTLRAMKQQLAELATIKTGLDAASRSTTSQIAKIADRLDRLDQHASLATETTGSIATVSPMPASAPAVESPKLTDRILPDWIVQDVRNGRALVQSRHGGFFDVGAGSVLPGVGRVDAVKRQDGQWIVLTASGTITSGR